MREQVAASDGDLFDASPQHEGARQYARLGLEVLPCHEVDDGHCSCGRDDFRSPGKHPRTRNGLDDATTDLAIIDRWWTRWPTANVAVRTGLKHDVLDIDPKGLDIVSGLVGGDDIVVACGPVVRTPRGGAHLLYEPTGLGNKAGFVNGCDWRGARGYALVPPSVGADGAAYEWHVENGETFDFDRPLVPVPGWLRALLKPAPSPRVATPTTCTPVRTSSYPAAALKAEADNVRTASEGHRNDQLNRSTHTLARLVLRGDVDVTAIETVMHAAGLDAGLSEHEVLATIRSALKARGLA
jgi:Bifunctional DNA primase/polymerase, N-terminal